MALQQGTRLGAYEIISPLGAGGMGEVYRARDTNLQRDVALKILPETMARDAQRMARFEREAQVLASLNHPNIAAIYGLEESNGIRALVMELVEGETLGERLRRTQPIASEPSPQGRGWSGGAGPGEGSLGSVLANDDTLPIAKQIAEALEYAHERGVIHRDLKPANVKITPEGTVKVLDFGLAKVLEAQDSTATMDMANSPTLSAMATQAGMILGTAAYMSPEQAKGQRVDRRADIWAFGCVLYEMLAGRKPFEGETISEVLAAVIMKDPDWAALPETTPPSVQRLVRRCLQKDQRQRLQAIGDARIAIEETLSGSPLLASPLPPGEGGPGEQGRVRVSHLRRSLPWAVAVGAILAAAVLFLLQPSPPGPPFRKFEINAGKLRASFAGSPEISPSGKAIAYISGKDLFVRNLDQLEPRKLYTLTGQNPIFWSPDSESIAFANQRELWQIPAAGGTPRQICNLPGPVISGAWGADGTIFFSAWRGDMYKVPAQGGDAKALGLQDPKTEVDFHDLSFLPGGRDLMYVVHLVGGHSRVEVLTGGKPKTVFNQSGWSAWSAAYSPTGYLIFMREAGNNGSSIWAASFSLSALKITGQPFLVSGEGHFPSISADGTLLYVMPAPPGDGQLVWVGRSGKIEGTIGEPQRGLTSPALSPDGKHIAATAESADGSEENIWIYDVATGVRTPLLSSSSKDAGGIVGGPAWTPDGKNILLSTRHDVRTTIALMPSDGSGQPQKLLRGALAWPSLQGDYIAYTLQNEDGSLRACYAAFSKGKLQAPAAKPLCLPRTSARDLEPRISPDGRYAAFVSENAGQPNIYVTQFPGGNGRWQVSTNRGIFPVWSPRGNELFYLAGNELMSAKVALQPSLNLSAPVKLFSLTNERVMGAQGGPLSGSAFAVSPSGQRFLMVRQVGEKPQPSMVVDQNWFAEFSNKKGM